MGRKFIGGRKVEQPYGNQRCGLCGREFTCGLCDGLKNVFQCHNSSTPTREPVGPCCSQETHDFESCWRNQPYFEDWKAGRYKP